MTTNNSNKKPSERIAEIALKLNPGKDIHDYRCGLVGAEHMLLAFFIYMDELHEQEQGSEKEAED